MAALSGEMAVLSIEIREKRFPAAAEAGAHPVLEDVRLGLETGETVAVLGASGCGKTTLLNLVAGLDPDFTGRIDAPPPGRLAYVFQEPRLLPWRSVRQNLALVLPREPDSGRRVDAVLAEVGLTAAADTFASRLSLGMARRAALARAFVIRPSLLLLDEPFVSLDAPTAARLRLLCLELLERHRVTALFVSHQLEEAVMLAQRLVVLGGTPSTVRAVVPVDLRPAERRDPVRVAALARRLAAGQELTAVLGEAGDEPMEVRP